MTLTIILAGVAVVIALLWFRQHSKRQRRERLLATPLSAEQREIVERLVPLVLRMPSQLRMQLEGKIHLFLDQITIRAKSGLEESEEMRLSIAAQACLLVVNSPAWFDTLKNVIVYPSTVRTRHRTGDGYVVFENEHHIAGESWQRGPVVLSWDHALRGGLDAEDGYNVVIHEFAHQLDGLTGHTNGIPVLSKGQAYAGWEKAMLEAFQRHVEHIETRQTTVIDPYGANNHEEFFAEAIVAFFEKPKELLRDEPALYSQLSKLLSLDPADWS